MVFVCKYRHDVLSELAIADLRENFCEVCADLGATLVTCNGEDDHTHQLVEYPSSLALSWLVKNLKGRSSRLLREYRPKVHGRYRSARWTPAYFVASCGGAPISVLRQYVQQQREDAAPPRDKSRGFRREKI